MDPEAVEHRLSFCAEGPGYVCRHFDARGQVSSFGRCCDEGHLGDNGSTEQIEMVGRLLLAPNTDIVRLKPALSQEQHDI